MHPLGGIRMKTLSDANVRIACERVCVQAPKKQTLNKEPNANMAWRFCEFAESVWWLPSFSFLICSWPTSRGFESRSFTIFMCLSVCEHFASCAPRSNTTLNSNRFNISSNPSDIAITCRFFFCLLVSYLNLFLLAFAPNIKHQQLVLNFYKYEKLIKKKNKTTNNISIPFDFSLCRFFPPFKFHFGILFIVNKNACSTISIYSYQNYMCTRSRCTYSRHRAHIHTHTHAGCQAAEWRSPRMCTRFSVRFIYVCWKSLVLSFGRCT